jgi:hypothetical protein
MRDDPAGDALIIMLRSHKVPGMAQAVQAMRRFAGIDLCVAGGNVLSPRPAPRRACMAAKHRRLSPASMAKRAWRDLAADVNAVRDAGRAARIR